MPALALVSILAAAVLMTAAACGGDGNLGDGGPSTNTRQVRGQIIEVAARSIGEVETLRVRDEAGQEYVFATEGFIGFTPSHLLEHRLLGQTVLVTYREENGRLIAIRAED